MLAARRPRLDCLYGFTRWPSQVSRPSPAFRIWVGAGDGTRTRDVLPRSYLSVQSSFVLWIRSTLRPSRAVGESAGRESGACERCQSLLHRRRHRRAVLGIPTAAFNPTLAAADAAPPSQTTYQLTATLANKRRHALAAPAAALLSWARHGRRACPRHHRL